VPTPAAAQVDPLGPNHPRDAPTGTRSGPPNRWYVIKPASVTATGTPPGTPEHATPWCTGRRWPSTARHSMGQAIIPGRSVTTSSLAASHSRPLTSGAVLSFELCSGTHR
jgi:hypothetical protein